MSVEHTCEEGFGGQGWYVDCFDNGADAGAISDQQMHANNLQNAQTQYGQHDLFPS